MNVTSTPLTKCKARDDFSKLSEEERDLLLETETELGWPASKRMILAQYLKDVEWDEEEAKTRAQSADRELERRGVVPISKYLEFVSVDADGIPSPCGVLMEDGHGECARDCNGNPTILIYGNFECGTDDAIAQMCYLMHRVQSRYIPANQLPHVTYVFDMKAREGKHTLDTSLDLNFLRFVQLFPQSYDLYICNAPTKAAAVFSLLPPGMKKHIKVSSSCDILDGVIDPQCMLPSWHSKGTFDFDLNRYIAYVNQNP